MKAYILFSGGKDSSLCSLMLSKFFEINLITCTFEVTNTTSILSKEISNILGFKHSIFKLDKSVLEEASDIILKDKYPNNGINYIHKKALLEISKSNKNSIIADGLRRDDRVPKLSVSEIRSIEDKYDVCYVSPLMGYGRSFINMMINKFFVIEENESKIIKKCDYESELRMYLYDKIGEQKTDNIFPKSHMQSRVISIKKNI